MGLLITAFYFACFAPSSKKVSADTIDITGEKIEIKTSSTPSTIYHTMKKNDA
jgi:hypothetical protein